MTQPKEAEGLVDTEPVIVALTGLAGVVDLGIMAASSLDWIDITAGQTASVVTFITAVTALIAAVLRARVYSPATVARIRSAI